MVNRERKVAMVKLLVVTAGKPYFIPKIEYIDGIGDAANKTLANTMGCLKSSTKIKQASAMRAGWKMSFPKLVHAISATSPRTLLPTRATPIAKTASGAADVPIRAIASNSGVGS